MASSFADLKKNRKSSAASLAADLEKLTKGNERSKDESFWAPTVDKAGNGYAVIRFLPAPPGESAPYVRYWDHGFQGPTGKWYIEKSLTSIGQEDPVAQFNGKLWNASQDDNSPERKQARNQKRRLHFISNILVIKDSANPENEGKVFKYKYGKKIFNKLNEKMNPEFEDETPMNPFDLWEGADFKLKIRQVEGYRNYDKSEFDEPSAIAGDDDALEAIWKSCHSLEAVIAPDQFKSYDELKRKLEMVLGLGDQNTAAHQRAAANSRRTIEDEDDVAPSMEATALPSSSSDDDLPWNTGSDDDDGLDFFKNLAAD
jgi:hypothetical protein